MKSLIKILTVLLLLNVGIGLTPKKASAQVGVSFQIFYDNLSPYGNWVENPSYGYVWIPGVGAGFSPYATSGHWVFTQFGWTWVSNYAWGWAPFHYGRWYFDPIYGWIWVPDTVWGPAWVAWSSAPGYYGWAPMEPGWDVNFVIAGRYNIPSDRWVFVSDRDIDRPDVERYYGPRGDNQKIISNSTVINKTYVDNSTHNTYIAGPDRNDVQKRTGKEVKPVEVHSSDKPGQKLNNNELAIYRPQVQKAGPNGEKPKPSKVVPLKEVKPVKERGDQQANPSKKMENKKAAPNAEPAKPKAPGNKKPQQKQEPQGNPVPENKNPKESPAQPRENNPGNNDQREQQAPAKDVKPVPENQAPEREVTKPNDNTPQQPPKENSEEIKNDQQEPPRENPQEIKNDQQQQQPEQPKPQAPAKKKKKPRG